MWCTVPDSGPATASGSPASAVPAGSPWLTLRDLDPAVTLWAMGLGSLTHRAVGPVALDPMTSLQWAMELDSATHPMCLIQSGTGQAVTLDMDSTDRH